MRYGIKVFLMIVTRKRFRKKIEEQISDYGKVYSFPQYNSWVDNTIEVLRSAGLKSAIPDFRNYTKLGPLGLNGRSFAEIGKGAIEYLDILTKEKDFTRHRKTFRRRFFVGVKRNISGVFSWLRETLSVFSNFKLN